MLSKVIRDRVDELCMDRVDDLCPYGHISSTLSTWIEFMKEHLPHNTYEIKLKLKKNYNILI